MSSVLLMSSGPLDLFFMLLPLGFLRVFWVECKSALCQGWACLLQMHHPVHAEKWAKDTRLYLGLIGAWRGPMGDRGLLYLKYMKFPNEV